MVDYSALDNPVWFSLQGPHSKYAEKTNLSAIYQEKYGSFCALSEYSKQAYKELASIVKPGRTVLLLSRGEVIDLPEWKKVASIPGQVMILEEKATTPNLSIEKLSSNDIQEMNDLSKVAGLLGGINPGKIEIGDYFGIKETDSIVSMGGERLDLDGFIEIASVCTHPDYLRRGFGSGLSRYLAKGIQDKGKIPFLQVEKRNVGAISLYEKLGFNFHADGKVEILVRTNQ